MRLYIVEALTFGLLLIAIISCAKLTNGSPVGRNSTSKPAGIELESARRALVALLEKSDDATLKAVLQDLSKSPTDKRIENAYVFVFGTTSELNLSDHSWVITIASPSPSRWIYEGEFQKDANGQWTAVQTSKHEQVLRGGRAR